MCIRDRLLDSLNPAERKRIVAILNVPPQVVTLDRVPMAADDKGANTLQAAMFSSVLQSALGGERQIRVAPSTTPLANALAAGPRGPGYGRRRAMLEGKEFSPGMYRFSQGGGETVAGVSFLAQVRLEDGSWVTFDTYCLLYTSRCV